MIALSDDAKSDIRAISQQTANERLAAIHRLAESCVGDIKVPHGNETATWLRVSDYRVRFQETKDEIRVGAVKNRRRAIGVPALHNDHFITGASALNEPG